MLQQTQKEQQQQIEVTEQKEGKEHEGVERKCDFLRMMIPLV